jgi:S1-C subfamily serine protease
MESARIKPNKTRSVYCSILVLSMLLMLTVPASTYAQDDNAVTILRQIGKKFAEIAENASPSVVVLKVERPPLSGQPGADELQKLSPGGGPPVPYPEPPVGPRRFRPESPGLRQLSPRMPPFVQMSMGLGLIVSKDGYILTCNDLVVGARKVNVELADGRKLEAKIVGTDPDTDIAVVKIEADNLPVLKLGDSDALSVGDWVVGISNAMGVGRTFEAGLITGKGRHWLGFAALEDFVQTSINLHIGDSGGPLLDLDGNVVGINVATFDVEHGGGVSFAIPINMAREIYEQLIKTGTVERGFLGIGMKDLTAELAKALGIETTKGVLITNVLKGSAAEKAGIRNYDVLVEFNGKPVKSASQLTIDVAALKPGTQVEVVVLRDGHRQNLTVTLGERPQEPRPDDVPNVP